MTYRLTAISAGLSNPSSTRLLVDRLVSAVKEEFDTQEGQISIDVLELRDSAQDTLTTMLSGFPVGSTKEALRSVQESNGIVLVTPLFNGTFSGLFKMFVDVLPQDALKEKPVLLGATGGTPRHSLAIDFALRPLMSYLKADVMPTAVFAATGDWANPDTVNPLPTRIQNAGTELATAILGRTKNSSSRHPSREPQDEFSNVPDFESLLNNLSF